MRLHQQGRHPMDEAVWLLEFLAKTKGAEHLRLESRNLNFIQYFSIDCMLFIIVVMYLSFKTVKRLICFKAKNLSKSKFDWKALSERQISLYLIILLSNYLKLNSGETCISKIFNKINSRIFFQCQFVIFAHFASHNILTLMFYFYHIPLTRVKIGWHLVFQPTLF